jgi:hypothetical protein
MSACGQPTEKRQKRAHNPFTAEEKVCLLNYADNNLKTSAQIWVGNLSTV